MEDDNFNCLTKKLDLFCSISGAKLSQAKCICLGWDEHPPGWLLKFGFQWGGPTTITKYLGIPFAVDPSIKDMWLWVKTKITKNLIAGSTDSCHLLADFKSVKRFYLHTTYTTLLLGCSTTIKF